jgi:hypothetical protein
MIMRIINSNLLNNSLERALNSRFVGGKNIILFLALFGTLTLLAIERVMHSLFNKGFKLG